MDNQTNAMNYNSKEWIDFATMFRGKHREDDAYHYIPYIRELHVFLLIKKRAKRMSSFCDAGCGFPIFPLMAIEKGFETAVGVENHKPYLEVLKPMFGEMIIDDDIMNHDFSNYDVIYSYSPFWGEKMIKFIEKVKSDMKKGSLFVVAGLRSTLMESEYPKRGMVCDREYGIDYFIK